MKPNYDFSQGVRNPYAKRLKRQLTIRLDAETVDYFQALSRDLALPYQTLINMYLRDCATTQRRPMWARRSTQRLAPRARRAARSARRGR